MDFAFSMRSIQTKFTIREDRTKQSTEWVKQENWIGWNMEPGASGKNKLEKSIFSNFKDINVWAEFWESQ